MTESSGNNHDNHSCNNNRKQTEQSQQATGSQSFSFKPYHNDHQSLQIGELIFENQIDKIIVYGDIEINKNQRGLNQALKLQKLFDLIAAELQNADFAGELIDNGSESKAADNRTVTSKEVDNPFS